MDIDGKYNSFFKLQNILNSVMGIKHENVSIHDKIVTAYITIKQMAASILLMNS